VARVSYLRPTVTSERSASRSNRRLAVPPRQARRGRFAAGGALLLLLAVAGVAALLFVSARASLTSDSAALAKIGMPLGGGTIEKVSVVTGPHSRPIPVDVRGEQIWPRELIPAHQLVSIQVVIKRPGWISWLAGKTERLHLTLMTPSSSLRQHYLTLRAGAPILLRFKQPIRVIAYGPPGHLVRRVLALPRSEIRLSRTAPAGSVAVAAAPRSWETSKPALVSWFPAGAATSAVANPAPGTQISPHTKITLTFSKTVAAALGSERPPVSPVTPGTWHTVNSHTIAFAPEGYGYGLGAKVGIALPNGVNLVGGQQTGTSADGTWTVPGGSTLRLQQLLAQLGYLPLKFNAKGSGSSLTAAAQEAAAIHPPAGKFSWSYPNVPDSLKGFWSPGASGVMTQGALMAFENDHALTTDGIAGAAVWRALINATISGKRSTFGYSYVFVSVGSQSLNLWHNGHTILTTAVNTGIASAPTATGTYPVYEHLVSGTMSGTNPDGSHYNDPGIQFISYFNGGDALHAFNRAQFGFPQSLGCVEMQTGPAGQVFPYTPIGTLVHVA
jgi:peptidoglycan hydrolase-like protein with peptidoglycan-binding domain